MPDTEFEFAILEHRWPDEVVTHRPDLAASHLDAVDGRRRLHTLEIEHVERYDWERQTLLLSEAATRAMTEAVCGAADASEAVPAMRRRLGWGNALEHGLYMRCFQIGAAGRLLYRGMFLDATSQRAVTFPVARVGLHGARARVSLLPVHVPFAIEDPIGEDGRPRRVPFPPEAAADLEQLAGRGGPFDAMVEGIATSAIAAGFRRLMRDPVLRQVMDGAGKLGSIAMAPHPAAD